MSEEKEAFRLRERLSLPPGYDEAVASSSRSDVSDNDDETHETQGLLFSSEHAHDAAGSSSRSNNAGASTRSDGYRAPTVQSVRSSFDSNSDFLPSDSDSDDSDSTASLRRVLEVMDVEEPDQEGGRSRIRERISKPFSIIGGAISSLGSSVGSRFSWITSRLPSFRVPFCTYPTDEDGIINFQRFIGVVIVVIVVYAFFATDVFTMRMNQGHQYDPDSVKRYLIDNVDPENIKHMLKYLSSFDHLAGTEGDYQMAEYVGGKFKEAGMRNIRTEEYEVYLNYPNRDGKGRRVAIVEPEDKVWEAKLEEIHFDTTKNPGKITPIFHGFSKSGNVTGHLVYANYGSKQDFDYLKSLKVDLKGAIVLVRYFGTEADPSIKVKNAQDAGAAGCIIYSDPKENGANRGKVWPEGRWCADDCVQRASVGLSRFQPGDPLSPGLPSTFHNKRIKPEDAQLSQIPSLPLSWRDAQHLIAALKKHGFRLDDDNWKGGDTKLEWWTGGSKGPKVNLMNLQVEHDKQKIWNILSTIEGYEQPRKAIIIGARRDSWAYGATSSMTGTAALLELVRVFGQMYDIGWRPARTIHFASWDGSQYNMVGSTEWVEENANELRMDGVVYINVGTAVTGTDLTVKGSPALQGAVMTAMGWFLDPVTNKTMKEVWGDKYIDGPSINTDSLAFTNFAGMASVDIGFTTKDGDQAFPLHSAYDSYDWMQKFGDPTWEFVPLLTKMWGVLTIIMSDSLVIPLNYVDYAVALDKKLDELRAWAEKKKGKRKNDPNTVIDWQPMKDTIQKLRDYTANFNMFINDLDNTLLQMEGVEPATVMVERLEHNNKLGLFETHMLDMSAVPGREWFKSTIFAPQVRSELDHLWYPAIVGAIEAGDWKGARFHLERIREILDNASNGMQ